MKLGQLLMACDNLNIESTVCVYDSLYDFDYCTANWTEYSMTEMLNSDLDIIKFKVSGNWNTIYVALL